MFWGLVFISHRSFWIDSQLLNCIVNQSVLSHGKLTDYPYSYVSVSNSGNMESAGKIGALYDLCLTAAND